MTDRLTIKILVVGEIRTNCYIMQNRETGAALIVAGLPVNGRGRGRRKASSYSHLLRRSSHTRNATMPAMMSRTM